MQNEPNFQKSQMFITEMMTRNYNEKYTMDTWSKQTQSNPICSEPVEPISNQLLSLSGVFQGFLW